MPQAQNLPITTTKTLVHPYRWISRPICEPAIGDTNVSEGFRRH